MKLIADTNTFIAVALEQPEKQWLATVTEGVQSDVAVYSAL